MGALINHSMIYLTVIACLTVSSRAANPSVLVHQSVVNRPPIGVNTGFDIDYTIINMADQAGKIVAINNMDSSKHDPLPEYIEGNGGRVQFRTHIVPKQAGVYKPAPIKVDYMIGEHAQSTLSTDVDPVIILSADDYQQATERFVKQYLIFASIAGLMTIMPLLQIGRDYFFYTHGCPNRLLAPVQRSKQS